MHSVDLKIASVKIRIKSKVKGVIERFNEFYIHFKDDTTVDPYHTIYIKVSNFEVIIKSREQTSLDKENLYFQGYSYDKEFSKKTSTLYVSSLKNIYQYSEEYLLFLFSELCFHKGLIIFHSASLYNLNNDAYIFFGPSGIGKSTLSKKLNKLNTFSDDMVVIQKNELNYSLHKTPFQRDKTFKEPLNVSIKGLYRLKQKSSLVKLKLSPSASMVACLGNQWFSEYNTEKINNSYLNIIDIFKNIPVFELGLSLQTTEKEILKILDYESI